MIVVSLIAAGGPPFVDAVAAGDSQARVARLPSPRVAITAAGDASGMYALGGGNGGSLLNEIVKFEPLTGRTSRLPGVLPSAHCCGSAVWTGETVYVFGGWTGGACCSTRIIRFDPATGSAAHVVAAFPAGLEGTFGFWDGRSRSDVGCPMGCAYVAGGWTGSGLSARIYRYDPSTDSLRVAGYLPEPLCCGAVAFDGASAYLLGGCAGRSCSSGPTDAIYRIDPITGSGVLASARLPNRLVHSTGAWVGDAAYAFGGCLNDDCGTATVDTVVRYDPFIGDVRAIPRSLPSARYGASAVSAGASAFIFGGSSWSWVGGSLDEIVRAPLPCSFRTGDTVPPTSSDGIVGQFGDAGWIRSSATVSIFARDSESDIARTVASLDGARFVYEGPFEATGDGHHALGYRSVDCAGNTEAWRHRTLAIDATPPVTALAFDGPTASGDALYVSESTRIRLSASDASSGVAVVSWTWRDVDHDYAGPFSLGGEEGAGRLLRSSRDVAGNVEIPVALGIFVDRTPPDVEHTSLRDREILLAVAPVIVGARASDSGSGVDRVEFLVDGRARAMDDEAPYEWSWCAGEENVGHHLVEARAVDRLGHRSSSWREVTTLPLGCDGVSGLVGALALDGSTAGGLISTGSSSYR